MDSESDIFSLMDRSHRSRLTVFLEDFIAPTIAFALLVMFWPVALCYLGWNKLKVKPEANLAEYGADREFIVSNDHLIERLTLEAVEASELVLDPLEAVPKLPFGHLNAKWLEFVSKLAPGDEIWSFSANWHNGWGESVRQGYALIRDHDVVDYFIATINDTD